MLMTLYSLCGQAVMLSPQEEGLPPTSTEATLYFRYRNSPMLARETRRIQVPHNMSPEQAIATALVDGPGSLSPHMTPLFPPGTKVLNLMTDGEAIFITFNAQLMARYPDEAPVMLPDYRAGEGRLRRRLAMAGLVNTLTQSGRYRTVQVLVHNADYITTSMRLSSLYYLEDTENYPPPLVRQEEYIHSPQTTAEQFMSAWRDVDWGRVLPLVRGSGEATAPDQLPAEHTLMQSASNAPRMVRYALTPGIVSLDGQSAVVSVSYTLLDEGGNERAVYARPMRLLLREGIYVIPYDTMLRMLELADE